MILQRWFLPLLVAFALSAQAQSPLSVGSVEASPGTINSGYIEIDALNDTGTRIPVSIIQGSTQGPTLALIAGTHGYEYPGITALQRVRATIDPDQLAGSLILVHIANPPSFYARTIYYSPADGQNLNRMYPGKSDGTLSQRIAFAITSEVIEQADFLIDLHAGDGNESLRPYVYMPVTGDAQIDEAAKGLAIAFGLDHIVIDNRPISEPDKTLYTDMTALTRGVPAITSETGQMGSNDDYWVDKAEFGVWNVMRHLQMLPGPMVPNDNIVWLTDSEVVRSPASGIFQAAVKDGYAIAEGGLMGTLVDEFGDEIQEIRAPFAGVINYIVGTPPVSAGEPVGMVSKIKPD